MRHVTQARPGRRESQCAGGRPRQPGDDAQQRGLAGAVLAEDAIQTSWVSGDAEVSQRGKASEELADILQGQERHAASS